MSNHLKWKPDNRRKLKKEYRKETADNKPNVTRRNESNTGMAEV